MQMIRKDHDVTFQCSSFLEDGHCLDDHSQGPIKMVAGRVQKNAIAQAVSDSLIGMKIKEIKHFTVPPRHGFGEIDSGKIFELPLEVDHEHSVGDELELKVTKGGLEEILTGIIIKIEKGKAQVDTNHPLAGQSILIKIKVLSFK